MLSKKEFENYSLLSATFKEPVYSDNHQPFRNEFSSRTTECRLDNDVYNRFADISFKKKEGGTYVYCNNPEKLAFEDINKNLISTENLKGDVIFTFEHSNYSGKPFFLGYRLKNDGSVTAKVTVTNIGMQVEGEWLGRRAWSDYFNMRFVLPSDYFTEDGSINPIYVGCDYADYTPRIYEPQTFEIPAGKYIYVLGGTSKDAYGNANAGNTADLPVKPGKCANGVVKFSVDEGSVTGAFFCYDDAESIKGETKEQGYITKRFLKSTGKEEDYSKQYKGVDPTAGLIESEICFAFDDRTEKGNLKVRYKKEADCDCRSIHTPYTEYSPKEYTYTGDKWVTSLNPNSCREAVGTDMMVFNCKTENGEKVVIDNLRSDGSGDPANTGNWMVQYTENITFMNAGKKARKLKVYKKGNGMLFVDARDENGNVLTTKAQAAPYKFASLDAVFEGVDKSMLVEKNGMYWFRTADGRPYCDIADEMADVIEFTVGPMSAKRMSFDYVVLGNSCGGVNNWVTID